jgi:UDP-N-acetylglucosamine diphosphorylase / glucose-1-phosphate thymidylyltransferase / UDP-N-acetylgalactosamine diphosphorylase / glucosamine-1-phosphate N-acetyltransferase / galactosamine-1-phosphate N-acetyltransferase
MNEVVLNDTLIHQDLFPFGQLHSVADIRVGILTIREKWEQIFEHQVVLSRQSGHHVPMVAANIIPDATFVEAFREGKHNQLIGSGSHPIKTIQYPWQIFEYNDEMLRVDFEWITRSRPSAPIPVTNRLVNAGNIFLEPGARVEHCILNASAGPIYLGKNTEVMEGSMIRGPFALCEGAVVKMGASLYGATSIGPYCTVGGEIKNSVLFGYSNKSHHGYLGDSVIGEWCNIGAGSSNSNLKNNAGPVRVWNQSKQSFLEAGLKCGLFMGDYSRCSINTAFNTGTVVGICCNIFGEPLPAKYIPNFSWGQRGMSSYELEKAIRDIASWMKMKNKSLQQEEIQRLKYIFEKS